MSTQTEDEFDRSEDDLDEDEATQYIIEQSLIQYRKLKGLNPRLRYIFPFFVYVLFVVWILILYDYSPTRDLKPSEDPDEIFKAIKEGKVSFFTSDTDSCKKLSDALL